MNKRKTTSGGQAIVMVTVALIAMCGMMGLAVDLGWSFFVQKQAQAVVGGAALAAVHEVFVQKNGAVSGMACGSGADCKTALSPPTSCKGNAIPATSNLYNGCKYASSNGFDYTKSNVNVTVVSNIGGTGVTPAPQIIGIPNKNIAYWATFRAVQTIPQLFSSVLGNTQGTVSAVATAAILSQTSPGSFRGMNHEGDCQTDAGGGAVNCGVDLDVAGSGKGQCKDVNNVNTQQASICGPAGIFLASQCNNGAPNVPAGGCKDGGTNNWAGQTHGNASVWGSVNRIQGSGWVNDNSPGVWTPPPVNGGSGKLFEDPTQGEPQPPIARGAGGSAVTPCPMTSLTLAGANLGPFSYYHVNSMGNADGQQLSLAPDAKFVANGQCPSNVNLVSNEAGQIMPTTVFYGGVNADNVNTPLNAGTPTFGPGQYVMAGTTSTSGSIFTSFKGQFTGDATSGTMFILTDANYPGLVQPPAISSSGLTFYQGNTYFKNISGSLTGIGDSFAGTASQLNQYGGALFWQDRRDTSLKASGYYDASGNWTSCPTAGVSCTPSSYHVTATSPKITLDHGNAGMTMAGVFYQPRGAWMELNAGGAAVANSPLQVITGSLVFNTGGGNANVVLLGPTSPLVTYRTALIQ